MIKLYNIINDPIPKLNVVQEFDMPDDEPISKEYGDNEIGVHLIRETLHLDRLNAEHLVCEAIDDRGHILGLIIVSIGSQSECYIHKRTIAEFILLTGAESFIVVHNHPNNVLEASEGDKETVQCLKELASLLEVEFGGDYVITKDGFINVETGNVRDDRWELYV